MIPIQNIYYLLCYAWNKLDEKDQVAVNIDHNTDLIDLLAKVLINSCTQLLKRGLEKDYIPITEERVGVKGKLEVSKSIKQDSFQHLKAVCTYDEYSADIIHNQILVTTLYRLLRTDNLDVELKDRLRNLLRRFPPVELIELKSSHFHRIRLHRNNRLYGFILKVCELLFENSLPSEKKGNWQFMDFIRNEKKMGTLFEEFVFQFYAIEMPELLPHRDHIRWNFTSELEEYESFLPLMKTDITLRGAHPKVIIDTKYYLETMQSYYDTEKVKSGNLYQLFSYLLHQEDGTKETLCTNGMLLYPTVQQELDLTYTYAKHKIQIKTVNLNTNWIEIERRLKSIVTE